MSSWPRRARAVVVLTAIFLRELLGSGLAVARAALSRDPHVSPAIVAVPLDVKTDAGITVVANLITLTPGTTSLHVSSDRRFLYVHCLNAPSEEDVINDIKTAFERWVLELET